MLRNCNTASGRSICKRSGNKNIPENLPVLVVRATHGFGVRKGDGGPRRVSKKKVSCLFQQESITTSLVTEPSILDIEQFKFRVHGNPQQRTTKQELHTIRDYGGSGFRVPPTWDHQPSFQETPKGQTLEETPGFPYNKE